MTARLGTLHGDLRARARTIVATLCAMVATAVPAAAQWDDRNAGQAQIMAVQARAAHPLPEALWHLEAVQNPRLGLAFPYSGGDGYALLSGLGMGVVRLGVSWRRLEPTRGAYDFGALDWQMRRLGALGITPFVTITPDHPAFADHTGTVGNGTPRDLDQWSDMIAALTERYDGDGIDDASGLRVPLGYLQSGNEFLSDDNRAGGWAGSPEALRAFFKATHDGVRRSDGAVQVVLGGLSAFNIDVAVVNATSANWDIHAQWSPDQGRRLSASDARRDPWRAMILTRLLPVLADGHFDMVDAHLYGPETRDAQRLQVLSQAAGVPALSSECGGPSVIYGQDWSGQRHFGAVLERNLAVLSAGGAFCLWFGLSEALGTTWHNQRTPLYDAALAPKPGVHAYRLLSLILADVAPGHGRPSRPVSPDPTGKSGINTTSAVEKTTAFAAAIATPAMRQYEIETRSGPVCLSFGPDKPPVSTRCLRSGIGVCIEDAASRTAHARDPRRLAQTCPDEGVALSGSGLLALIERNQRP